MFFQECARLADEHPGLAPLAARIDGMLRELGGSCVVRPDDTASLVGETVSRVSGALEFLSREGLLRREEYLECPRCSSLLDPIAFQRTVLDGDRFECSQCQNGIADGEAGPVTVYRLNARRLATKGSKEDAELVQPPSGSRSLDHELPNGFLSDPFKNTHLLRYYSQRIAASGDQPFADKRMLFVLHFLRDLVPFVKAAVNLGLDPRNAAFFFKEYPYPQREPITKWLESQDAVVMPRSAMSGYLGQLERSPSDRVGQLLVVEDGGFIVPAIHNRFPGLGASVIGAVEQTTRGIRNDEGLGPLVFPVVSVATSKLKAEFEAPYIGRAVVTNFQRLLPSLALSGRSVALVGYGTIGRQIADWLKVNRANVTVFDPLASNALIAGQNGFLVADSASQAVRNKSIVVGASGLQSIDSTTLAALSHGTYLISASSEQYEIDVDELAAQASRKDGLVNENGEEIGTTYLLPPTERQIHLVANGYPINFWGSESMPEEASDLIMSLLLLCAIELAAGHYNTPGISSDAVHDISDKYEIARKFIESHKQG